MAKKELEEKENDFFHTGQYCDFCGEELTKEDLDYIEKLGGPKICAECRYKQEKMEKE